METAIEVFIVGGLILSAYFVGYYAGAFWHTDDSPVPVDPDLAAQRRVHKIWKQRKG